MGFPSSLVRTVRASPILQAAEGGESPTMCNLDPKTGTKVSDCGHCGCGHSTKSGQHHRVATGETVKAGNEEVPTYKCGTCGTYMT
jgi:hypothetical protein